MLEQPFLRRLVVIRRHGQQAVRAGLLHLGGGVNHFLRVVAAGARQDRHAAVGFVDEDLDNPQALGQRERRALTGGADGDEKVDARVDLPPAEPANRRFVEAAALGERGDERRAASGEWGSHARPLF